MPILNWIHFIIEGENTEIKFIQFIICLNYVFKDFHISKCANNINIVLLVKMVGCFCEIIFANAVLMYSESLHHEQGGR